MPYIKQKFFLNEPKIAFKFLMSEFGLSLSEAQRYIDKKRLYLNNEIFMQKGGLLRGNVEVVVYKPEPLGLKPIFETDEFAIFDKPSGVLTHQNGRNCKYSLNDEIISLFGTNAKVAHRLDFETSGLILVAKNKSSEVIFKKMFEKQEVKKQYLALVFGKIEANFSVDMPLNLKPNSVNLKNKIYPNQNGKSAKTEFEIIKFLPNLNATLLKCTPKTGRQHQIRVHLFHVKHSIIGDTLYGVSDEFANDFLDGKISSSQRLKTTGAKRLLLHSWSLSFNFKQTNFHIQSQINFENEIMSNINL